MDLEKSDKLADINTILDENFPPYYTDTFAWGETKQQLGTSAINWLDTFISNVNNGLIGGIRWWVNNLTWSSSAYNSVTYSSGTLTLSNGFSYSITGATVTLTTITYIYLDTAISITALQTTTTASDSVGGTKILVCVANPTVSGKNAQYQVFWGDGSNVFINADNIAANSITSNEIATNTITANNLSTALLYAGSITLDTNGNIKSWQTAYNTWTGFFFWDDLWETKLSMGNGGTRQFTYDSINLSIIWWSITWWTIQTGTSGKRIVMTWDVFTSYDSYGVARFMSNGSWFRLNDDTWGNSLDIQGKYISGLPTMALNGAIACDLITWDTWTVVDIYTKWWIISFWYVWWWGFPWYISAPDDYTIAISLNRFSIGWLILEKSWTDLYWNWTKIN